MKRISMYEWLDADKISRLLSDKELNYIKAEYRSVFEDQPYDYMNEESAEIEFKTGYPLAESFFESLIDADDFTYDVESEQEYIYRHAECIMKCNILCACQIAFKFPLWQSKELLEWEDALRNGIQDAANKAKDNDTFFFPCFFPHYSNEYVWYPCFMLKWILDVIDEFFDVAESDMYHLTPEERARERQQRREELQRMEDYLSGKRKTL